MDANGDATHALFTGEAMMFSPARSTASTVIPDIERYPILIEGGPVSSVILIGTVSHSNVRMDHWSFELRDATGIINVSYWLETAADSKLAWSTRFLAKLG
ncbi:hypothetical protein ZWY2020_007317 [Hordeum vulgare]|nr:hypothetical protein ZWY2020_007317 [Hordeum vulgare]